MIETRLCIRCGYMTTGTTSERPILWRKPCACGGNWRVLDQAEAAELYRLPAWDLSLYDLFLCIAFRIDPELPEGR